MELALRSVTDATPAVKMPPPRNSAVLPVTLDGGGTPGNPSQAVVGKLFVGCYADGGGCPPNIQPYRVIAIVNTSDPYAPRVMVPITAIVQGL